MTAAENKLSLLHSVTTAAVVSQAVGQLMIACAFTPLMLKELVPAHGMASSVTIAGLA